MALTKQRPEKVYTPAPIPTVAAAVAAGLLAVAAVALSDIEAAAVALVSLVGLGLMRTRRAALGRIITGLNGINIAFWTIPGTISNVANGQGGWQTLLPGLLAVAALVGVAGVAVERFASGGFRRPILIAAAALTAIVLLLGLVPTGGTARMTPGDLILVTEGTAFSQTELNADPGAVGVFVENRDLFWHTFTVSELDVNLNIPVGGKRRLAFDAPAGSYTFTSMIPGHERAGMRGTLVVG